jgi:SRSO17 transposase
MKLTTILGLGVFFFCVPRVTNAIGRTNYILDRQSLHHLAAKAPWSDETLLEEVRNYVLPAMQKQGPVVAWIVDDTGFPKKGEHSAVSLSVATWNSSLPIAYRLYLPKDWAEDRARRKKTEVPKDVEFQTKPEIALDQIRAAVAAQVGRGVVLADAAYGINTEFRDGLTKLKLQYGVGVQSSLTVWEPGKQPLPRPEAAGSRHWRHRAPR